MNKINKKLQLIVLSIIFLCLFLMLFIMPLIGNSDNGDFARTMQSVGISYFEKDASLENLVLRFEINDNIKNGFFFTTQAVVLKFAVVISNLFFKIFDIRLLSFLYLLFLILGLYYILKYIFKIDNLIVSIALSLILIFAVCDVGYVGYLNSLYGEGASYAFFVFFIGIFLKIIINKEISLKNIIFLSFASVLFIGAKAQNAILGIIIGLYFLRFVYLFNEKNKKIITIFLSLFLIAFSCTVFVLTPKYMTVSNNYNSIMNGILKQSENKEADLIKLGISKQLLPLAGFSRYEKNLPIDTSLELVKKEFDEKISKGKIVSFYIKNPTHILKLLNNTAKESFVTKIHYLRKPLKGEKNINPFKEKLFSAWSGFKGLFPKNFAFIFMFFVIYLTALIYNYKKSKNKLAFELTFLICLFAIIEYPLQVIGDGYTELAKHLFLFNLCFDALIIIALISVAKKFNK